MISTPQGAIATALLVTFCLALAAGAAAQPPLGSMLGAGAVAMGSGLIAAGVLGRERGLLVLGLMSALALGLLRGSLVAHAGGPQTVAGHLGTAPVAIIGRVRDGVAPGRSRGLVVDAAGLVTADTEVDLSGAVLVPVPPGLGSPPVPGERVRVEARGLRSPGNRPGPRSAAALQRAGVDAIAVSASVTSIAAPDAGFFRALEWVRLRLTGAIDAVLPEPDATLLLGVAFGLRGPLAADVTAPLQDSGLFHIVVVSGLKVIIVAGMVRAVARARGWSRRRYAVIALTCVGGYVLISGAGPAAVRSAVMAGLALVLGRGGRRTDPVPILALTAAVMLAIDPQLWSDVGFQLSFIGTAGILLLADRLGRRLPGPALLREPFAVTIAAQAATLPIMAGTFGVISLVGPVANALVLPLLPALIALGGAGGLAAAVQPALGWFPLQLAGAGVDGVRAVAVAASSVPGGAIHVGEWPPAWTLAELTGLGAMAVVLAPALLRRHRTKLGQDASPAVAGEGSHLPVRAAAALGSGVLAAAMVLAVGARPDGRLHLTVLDVGAAPAVLMRTGEGALALVDGGPDPNRLLTALGRVLEPTVRRLDLVVLSGADRTSVAGLAGLRARYQVDQVMTAGPLGGAAGTIVESLSLAGASVEALDNGTRLWSGVRWRCLPVMDRPSGPACLLAVSSPDARSLLLGAASVQEQEQAAGVEGNGVPAADVVVAPPGGALAPSLVDRVRPAWIAVPTAVSSRSQATDLGAPSLRTGTEGDIEFDGGDRGLRPRRGGG